MSMFPSIQELSQEKNAEYSELSILQIFSFFLKVWKTLALFAFLGIVVSVTYILLAPKQYEAVALIRMAQISQINPNSPFGAVLEEPVSLIARMQIPTNYSIDLINACQYQDKNQPALALSKDIKITIPRGVPNSVEVRLLAPTPKIAHNCAQVVFDVMRNMQQQFAEPFIEEAKIKLQADNERIEAAKILIAKSDESRVAMSAGYLSARDELTYFLTDREKMMDLINSVKNRGTSLASPIYVSDHPVAPKKIMSLVAGLLGGFLLGLMISLAQYKWKDFAKLEKKI